MPGDVLVLSEVFGPTIQGEGRHAGLPCVFVRLGRCNLDCRWCDTPYTWDWEHYDPATELTKRTVTDVLAEVEERAVSADTIIVVSGGEPLLQPEGISILCAQTDRAVHIETNGTRPPVEGVAWYSVSPKLLPSAGIARSKALKPMALKALAHEAGAVKLVVDPDKDEDLDVVWACEILSDYGWKRDRIDLMPEGATPARFAETRAYVEHMATVLQLGFSERLHVSLLGGGRGV